MKKILRIYIVLVSVIIGQQIFAAPVSEGDDSRNKEKLGRGLVAIRKSVGTTTHVCVSWRYLSTDDISTKFNVYRGLVNANTGAVTSIKKVNDEPISSATWYEYEEKVISALRYYVTSVNDDVESEYLGEYTLKRLAEGGGNQYIEIPMKQIDGDTDWGYEPNDAVVADLDGDGEFELVIHRSKDGKDNSHSGITPSPILQAYKLDGTFMWEISLGPNIREGAHYTQFMVYDLDGDGKAEIVCKTAEGTIDSKGTAVGEAYADTYKRKFGLTSWTFNKDVIYRNGSGYILSGPEFLTVFDGETGEEVVTTEYDPPRYSGSVGNTEIPVLNPTGSQINSRWGDNYGNRVDRFLACVAYLDGVNPSVVMCRGYYTRSVLVAYDYKDKKLTKRWKFDTWNNFSDYAGQGNHNLRVADVDGDGCDEIIYGSATINNNGTGLYNTKKGHGDAQHISDLIPERPGLEVLQVHENKRDGTSVWDAKTGEIIYNIPSGDDVGRGMTADIDPRHRGMEFWSSRSDGVRSGATGEVIRNSTSGVSMNMACWWDGDLLRELQDGTSVTKYNYEAGGSTTLLSASGCSSNNSTKANPCLQADVLGDWREEVILRTSDNKAVRIYLTPYETDYRFHTFLEDPVYRMSIVYQNVAYNQPTHVGFYFGPDLEDIFPEKNIIAEDETYTLDPVFDAISYKWSTGETTKQLMLNSQDHEQNKEIPVSLEMNFRGHIFKDEITVTFTNHGQSGIDNILSQDKPVELVQTVVQDELLLKVFSQGIYQIKVFNTSGILCLDTQLNASSGTTETLSISNLVPGVYIISVVDNAKVHTMRFIKTK